MRYIYAVFRPLIEKGEVLIYLDKPLYDLLKTKTEFVWNDEALAAFGRLKEQLISEPILAIYSASAATELHCDASAHGYGSVLLRKQTSRVPLSQFRIRSLSYRIFT